MNKKYLYTSLVASALLLAACGDTEDAPSTDMESDSQEETTDVSFNPGTYTGTGEGMIDEIKLDVTFSENEITDIEVNFQNESDGIGNIPIEQIPQITMEYQSLDTDVVSGATGTSHGVKQAIEDAVEQAEGNVDVLKAVKIPSEAEDAEYDYDVVVAGGGLAGLMSSLKAANEGANVALVEKVGLLGGTSVTASGNLLGASAEEYKEPMYNAWQKRSASQEMNPVEEDMLRALIDASPDVFDLFDQAGVEFNVTLEDDGSQTYRGKPNEESIRNAEAIQMPSKDPNKKGGSEIIKKLITAIEDAGVDVYYNTPVTELMTDDDGSIVGVVSDSDNGNKIFNASAVVLATGDYARNEELTAEINPYGEGEHTATQVGNTGDGLLMALEEGAVLHDFQEPMSGVFNANPYDMAMIGDPTNGYPFESLVLNMEGERVFAEDGGSHPQKFEFRREDGLNTSWVVMDEEIAQNFVHLDEYLQATEDGHPIIRVYEEETIEDLAQHMDDISVETLLESVKNYNSLVEQGEDTQHGKDPELLEAIDEGPFYLALMYDATRGNYGGIRTNPQTQVIDENGNPIRGLYAGGLISSGQFFGDFYPGRQAIGIASHMGYISGGQAANYAAESAE